MSRGDGRVPSAPSPDSLDDDGFYVSNGGRGEGGGGGLESECGSPLSCRSRYSSCGESDFERYCSANSALGTPSLCSSVGTFHECAALDFDSGSTRSLGSMDGDVSLGGSRDVDTKAVGVGASVEKEDLGMLLSSVEDVLNRGSINAMATGDKVSNALVVYGKDFCGSNFNLSSSAEFRSGQRKDVSLKGERSYSEDYKGNGYHQDHRKEADRGNMILMNSSIAFGSTDWDDFELDKMENGSDLFTMNESWPNEAQSHQSNINLTAGSSASVGWEALDLQDQDRAENEVPQASDEVQDVSELTDSTSITLVAPVEPSKVKETQRREYAKDSREGDTDDEAIEYLEGCQVYNIFEKTDPLMQSNSVVSSNESTTEKEPVYKNTNLYNGHHEQLDYQEKLESPAAVTLGQASLAAKDIFEDLSTKNEGRDKTLEVSANSQSTLLSSGDVEKNSAGMNTTEDNVVNEAGKFISNKLNAFYDEVVHDMEEILLESSESPVTRLNQSNKLFHSRQPSSLRDGGSTASTSGNDDNYNLGYTSFRVDGIEVVGAKQKKGDISLSERLVGVKEYTVYIIRVCGGEDQWEVERRYREFYTLYRELKSFFSEQGWVLPSPWSVVERESKKIFGNSSPTVIVERSALIEECLLSVVKFRYPSGPPGPLIWFLSHPRAHTSQSDVAVNQSGIGSDTESTSSLGKKISLIVEILPHKSMKEMLEAQHYTCGGCHKHFGYGKTRVSEIVQTLGWGKPRRCEYTGQLFCSSCHTNDSAVLPARVLHLWDFTEYPVSQLAKSYLDSIIDQPMLCVSAVNPFLFTKVKVLHHVVGIRRKIGALLQYVRCPYRGSIYRGLGSRSYLLDSNDFFALRDLTDLSRGAFAALPVILETVLKRIQEHITEQCLVCCDVGVPCGARQACDDLSSLIFPFQNEEEIRRCGTCNVAFHKNCFKRLIECPCGARLNTDAATQLTSTLSLGGRRGTTDRALSLFREKSDLGLRSAKGMGFLSSLFSVGGQENSMGQQEGNNVILMGSLPGN